VSMRPRRALPQDGSARFFHLRERVMKFEDLMNAKAVDIGFSHCEYCKGCGYVVTGLTPGFIPVHDSMADQVREVLDKHNYWMVMIRESTTTPGVQWYEIGTKGGE
jgi:cytosine/adenosine deaminase-related metal-dependent hydrolase